MQSDFLGNHLRCRHQGYLTLCFACHSNFLGANLRLTETEQLEFYCILQNGPLQAVSSFKCCLGGCAVPVLGRNLKTNT